MPAFVSYEGATIGFCYNLTGLLPTNGIADGIDAPTLPDHTTGGAENVGCGRCTSTERPGAGCGTLPLVPLILVSETIHSLAGVPVKACE